MKEEDLTKRLDNILIDGLIKEAEQDNADFEAAMRNLEDSEFSDIIGKKALAKPSLWKAWRPWVVSVTAAAAVILAVIIPSINAMNARLCDSALYMSQDYISASKGGLDISTASIDQIKEEIPSLKQRYESLLRYGRREQPIISQECADAAWDLIVAYLKVHKKSEAVELLKTLATYKQGTPIGDHCKMLLEQLD